MRVYVDTHWAILTTYVAPQGESGSRVWASCPDGPDLIVAYDPELSNQDNQASVAGQLAHRRWPDDGITLHGAETRDGYVWVPVKLSDVIRLEQAAREQQP